MAGIYIHIPYCKQACYYCDFHFSTNVNTKSDLIDAIVKEIDLREGYLDQETIETIYFGGGTPSLLDESELSLILNKISSTFKLAKSPEVTIETNPDDLTIEKLESLKSLGFNRLSIGIQSFDNKILKSFNRAHDADTAQKSVILAQQLGFDNISIDLIFGVPDQSIPDLLSDIKQAINLKTQHISIYGLTIEENTVFGKWEKQNKLKPIDEDLAAAHLELIMKELHAAGFEQYEISNFSQSDFRSQHNSSYWHGKKYLGLGPAAHSYNGQSRQYNVANNIRYIKGVNNCTNTFEIEHLSNKDCINEAILMQIRLVEGIDLNELKKKYGFDLMTEKKTKIQQYISLKLAIIEHERLKLTKKGKLVADFITENLII